LCLYYKYRLVNLDKEYIHIIPTLKIIESHTDTLEHESEFQCKRKYVHMHSNLQVKGLNETELLTRQN